MLADLDDHFTCLWMISCPPEVVQDERPRISSAELIALAVAQILLQCHSERRFLRLARQDARPPVPLHPQAAGL